MDFETYQAAARTTSKLPLDSNDDILPPLLGLASEIGSLLDVYKRYLRDGTDLAASRAFFREELGDLLWYTAAVASASKLHLDEIAEGNLEKTRRLYPTTDAEEHMGSLPILDEAYPETERFPRRIVMQFTDTALNNRDVASVLLIAATPNAFPGGPISVGEKLQGYVVGQRLGAPLTDNSRRPDDYRFHDAIHLAFVAVLGWSPTMRALLQLKRRSDKDTDDAEDGARAIYAEEGLSAVLSHLSARRSDFQVESNVDSSTLMVVQAASSGLEVERLPLWLWRRAISAGFVVMRKLAENRGGFVIADLNRRTLTFSSDFDASAG